jgi:succinate dehydrogenase / fumarate reductase flavoprotein subunit
MEYTMTRLLKDADGRVSGIFGYRREDGRFVVFHSKAVVLATGGWGKVFKFTSNSWESTGDGLAMAFEAGAELIDLEFVQFHPTGMIWPPGARGILVTEAVRGEGGRLKNSEGRRFMEAYDPDRMELSARDIVARSIYKEVEAGRGSTHGGAYLDITHRGADYIKHKLPSMHEQFLKLADVDITKEPMEIGPTIHYVMGGVKVDPETAASTSVPGLFAAGESAGGLHGANRLGGNSLSDILVFGRRAGEGAAAYAKERGESTLDASAIEDERKLLLKPFENYEAGKRENPFQFMAEIQEVNGEHNGLARTGEGLDEGLKRILALKPRLDDLAVPESVMFNPGWHACRDQRYMVEITEAMIRAGIERKESRGSHWRLDHLDLDAEWGKVNIVCTLKDGEVQLEKRPAEPIPPELAELIDDKPAVSQAALQATQR